MDAMTSKSLEFEAQGVPPIKSQLWAQTAHAGACHQTRRKAYEAMTSQSLDKFISDIGLELEIFGRRDELDEIGDLGNMLDGVCDGLSKRRGGNPNMKPSWPDFEEDEDCGPDIPLLYDDDKIIMSLKGLKIVADVEMYYTVKIFELQ